MVVYAVLSIGRQVDRPAADVLEDQAENVLGKGKQRWLTGDAACLVETIASARGEKSVGLVALHVSQSFGNRSRKAFSN